MRKFQFDDTITDALTGREYPIARALKIGAGAARLYELEARIVDTIQKASEEITKLSMERFGWPKHCRYTHAIPQSLIAALDAFQHESGEVAAISFLLARGYEVSKP